MQEKVCIYIIKMRNIELQALLNEKENLRFVFLKVFLQPNI